MKVFVLSIFIKGNPEADVVGVFDNIPFALADGKERVARYDAMGFPHYRFEVDEFTLQTEVT
jgi:hypothetical protein